MKPPFAVVFSGVPGSSKTIISNYLSAKFLLPIFNNDQLRFEVKEDMMAADINRPDVLAEYEKRYRQRLDELLSTGHPMILDGSIDRRWSVTKEHLDKFNYKHYMIEMAFSEAFLKNFFLDTGRAKFLDKLPKYLIDHQKFLDDYSTEISLRITDNRFKDRLKIAAEGVQDFINSLEN